MKRKTKPPLYNIKLNLSHPLCRNGKLRWLVNEQTGTRLYDSLRQLKDGTIFGGAWSDGGVVLDGSDNYISAPHITGLSDWSIALTYTPDTVSGIHPLFDQGEAVIYQDGRDLVYGFRKAGGPYIFSTAFSVFAVETAVDIVVTKSSSTYTVYGDGILLDSFNSSDSPDTSASSLNVGRQVSWVSANYAGISYASAGNVSWFDGGTDDISISMWIRRAGNPSTNEVLCEKYGSGVGYSFYINTSGALCGYLEDSSGATSASGGFVCDGSWHHVAVVMDRSGYMQLYIDGVSSGSAVDISSRNSTVSNAAYCRFGAASGGHLIFGGEMLDVKIYIASDYWTSEEVSYQTSNALDYSSSVGSMTDYWVGNDNTGIILSGQHSVVNCAGINYASAGNVSWFDGGTDDISISMWIRREGNPSTNEVLCEKYGSGVGYSFYINTSGALRGYLQDSSGATSASGDFVCDGSWHHVAVVMDRSGYMQLYIDGVSSGSAVDISSQSSTVSNTAYCRFGAASGGHLIFGGEMLDVKIYIASDYWTSGEVSYQASNALDYSASVGSMTDYWIGNDSIGTILSGQHSVVNCAGINYASAGNVSWFDGGTDDISISMWIRREGNPSTNEVLCEKHGSGLGYSFYINTSGALRGYLEDSSGATSASGDFVCDGSWHHVAVVMDRSGNMQLYIDGVSSGSAVDISARNSTVSNTAYCRFGAGSGGSQIFGGEMLDAKIYIASDRWTSGEISYQASNVLDYSSSAGSMTDYWIGNDSTGTILSGQNNDLTLTSADVWSYTSGLNDLALTSADVWSYTSGLNDLTLTSADVWSYANGRISDMAVWNKALSPSAAKNYHSGKYCMVSYGLNNYMAFM